MTAVRDGENTGRPWFGLAVWAGMIVASLAVWALVVWVVVQAVAS
jgi:hypothetical protein